MSSGIAAQIFLVTVVATITASVVRAGDSPMNPVVALHAGDSDGVILAYPDSILRLDPSTGATTLVALPAPVTRIDAFAVSAEGTLYLAAAGSGIWISDDRGTTWRAGGEGLPNGKVRALTAHASHEQTVYAYVSEEGIYRSESAGRSWTLMDAGPEGMTGPFVHTDMPGSMQTGWLFAATKRGISRSMDCFCLWRDTGAPRGDVYAVAYDPDRPERIVAASESRILQSANGGEDWTSAPLPAAAIRALSYSASGALYAGSAAGILYVSTDEAGTWRRAEGARR